MPGDDDAPPASARAVLPAVLAGLVVAGILGYRLVDALGRLHTTGGWTVFALYLVGAVLLGAAAAAAVHRSRPHRTALRRDPAWLLATTALVGAVILPTAAIGAAEVVTCVRGEGLEVAVELTGVEVRRGADLLVGTYVVDGERHTLRVREDDETSRATAPGRYRVPWAGSDRPCGTDRDSDAPALALHLAGGVLVAVLAGGALAGAVRRWRLPDESGGEAGSDRA